MGNLAEHKLYLIQLISEIDNPSDLEWLERELEKLQAEKKSKTRKVSKRKVKKEDMYENLKSEALKKPYQENLDVETIKKEQGWTGQHDKEGMMQLIREMNIQEPVEELLAMLTP